MVYACSGLMSFVRRPNSSIEKAAPNTSPMGTMKARQLRVFVLSDMLLYVRSNAPLRH
jgi:hypothetical protein